MSNVLEEAGRAFHEAAPDLVWVAQPTQVNSSGILHVELSVTDAQFQEIAFRKNKILKHIQEASPKVRLRTLKYRHRSGRFARNGWPRF